MIRAVLIAVLLVVLQQPGGPAAQEQAPNLAPGSAGPNWQRSLRLGDGRLFVTDGAMAIDASLAKPATLPAEAPMPAGTSFIERQLAAQLPDEVGLSSSPARMGGPTARRAGFISAPPMSTSYAVPCLRHGCAVAAAAIRWSSCWMAAPLASSCRWRGDRHGFGPGRFGTSARGGSATVGRRRRHCWRGRRTNVRHPPSRPSEASNRARSAAGTTAVRGGKRTVTRHPGSTLIGTGGI